MRHLDVKFRHLLSSIRIAGLNVDVSVRQLTRVRKARRANEKQTTYSTYSRTCGKGKIVEGYLTGEEKD